MVSSRSISDRPSRSASAAPRVVTNALGSNGMHKDASRRKFDVVMAWAIALDQQNIDTTRPHGKLLFQITGAFGEFQRSMIRQRVRAGLNVIKNKLARDGKFESKRGIVRTKLGRPGAEPDKLKRPRLELAKGIGIGKVAREVGLGWAPSTDRFLTRE